MTTRHIKLSPAAAKVYRQYKRIYETNDICIADLLGGNISLNKLEGASDLNPEDIFHIYILLLSEIEGDRFFRTINDTETEEYIVEI